MLLETNNITLWYKWKKIIENFSQKFDEWFLFWIYWHSWIWKTTLLKALWWLLKPMEWEIIYNNNNIYKISSKKQRQYIWLEVWFIFQEFNLIWDFTVKENIQIPQIINWKKIDKERYEYLIDYFEIGNIINSKVNDTSWWQKERITITRWLIQKPKILLADEPWSNLNIELKEKVFKFLKSYSKDNIVVCVSHDIEFKTFFDTLCYLN